MADQHKHQWGGFRVGVGRIQMCVECGKQRPVSTDDEEAAKVAEETLETAKMTPGKVE